MVKLADEPLLTFEKKSETENSLFKLQESGETKRELSIRFRSEGGVFGQIDESAVMNHFCRDILMEVCQSKFDCNGKQLSVIRQVGISARQFGLQLIKL